MASLRSQLADALASDNELSGWHEGRVYLRPLKRSGNRSTPEAYDANGQLRPSLVLADGGDTPDLFYEDRAFGFITVWLHGPDRDVTREEMETMVVPRIIWVTMAQRLTGIDNTGAHLSISDRFGVRDDPGNNDAILDYIRFSVSKLWRTDNG